MKNNIPQRSVADSKHLEEFKDFLSWRGSAPTITIMEAFDMGWAIAEEKIAMENARLKGEIDKLKDHIHSGYGGNS